MRPALEREQGNEKDRPQRNDGHSSYDDNPKARMNTLRTENPVVEKEGARFDKAEAESRKNIERIVYLEKAGKLIGIRDAQKALWGKTSVENLRPWSLSIGSGLLGHPISLWCVPVSTISLPV